MKNKAIFVSAMVFFALVALSIVSATSENVSWVDVGPVNINGVDINGNTLAGDVSDNVPVEIEFTADDNLSDVRVKAYIEGYKDEIEDETSRFHIVDGSTYVKRLSLNLPSSVDLDDLTEGLEVYVRISAKGEEEAFEDSYTVRMQKEVYGLNLLSVEMPDSISTGSVVALDTVLENNGNDDLENVYVKASIPELGVDKKVYFGDLSSEDDCEDDDDDDCDEIDTVNRRVYLSIPRGATPGVYNLEIEAYNYDTSTVMNKKITITGADTGVISPVTSRAIATGEKTSFDVVLVNPNDRMVVYSITPDESKGLIIDIEEPVVTIPADSSKTVEVNVKATESAEEGTHVVKVNVNSEDGLVKQVPFTVSVEDSQESNAVVVLTIILAIVFVVLLVILIILLTKKPAEAEEFEETSYY